MISGKTARAASQNAKALGLSLASIMTAGAMAPQAAFAAPASEPAAAAAAETAAAAGSYTPMTPTPGIGMPVENAFLILSIIFPGVFSQPASIRRFLDDYAMTHIEAGRDEIRRLRLESISAIVTQRRRGLQPQAAQPQPERLLKAS